MAQNVQHEQNRALRNYAAPTLNGHKRCIRRPTIEANKFKIKLDIIAMIQTSM